MLFDTKLGDWYGHDYSENYCTFECSVEIGNRLFEQTYWGYRSKKKVRQKFDEFVSYFKDHPYPGERSPQMVFGFMY